MHSATQEELNLGQNSVRYHQKKMKCYQIHMSQVDFVASNKEISQDDQKGLKIKLRERVSYQQFRQEVNQVNHISEFLQLSKQKRRQNFNGFQIRLTYITEKIIDLSLLAQNFESIYRNLIQDIQRFFDSVYPGHYKVYNLRRKKI